MVEPKTLPKPYAQSLPNPTHHGEPCFLRRGTTRFSELAGLPFPFVILRRGDVEVRQTDDGLGTVNTE